MTKPSHHRVSDVTIALSDLDTLHLFQPPFPTLSLYDYNELVYASNVHIVDSLEPGHYYLLALEDIRKGTFNIKFVHLPERMSWNPQYCQCIGFLGAGVITNYYLFGFLRDTSRKVIKHEIDSILFAKAERIASLYQASVKALFGRAFLSEKILHIGDGLSFSTPYIVNNNDTTDNIDDCSLVYVKFKLQCELAYLHQKRTFSTYLLKMKADGTLTEYSPVLARIPYPKYKEVPRSIFTGILERHKSYCESILSLASEYICPPSATIDIRYIL